MVAACDNPFAVHRVLAQRYRFDEAGWEKLFARLEAQNRRGALVGPKGTGKTTLLEDLSQRLVAQGRSVVMLRLSTDPQVDERCRFNAVLANVTRESFVLLDGAEQLSATAWWQFRFQIRHAAGVVVTTHRGGRLPLLHRCETSPALLNELVCALGATLSPADAAALHRRHRGNLRAALRELYDLHAKGAAIPGFPSPTLPAHSLSPWTLTNVRDS
jgi:hypothetical protein